MNPTIGDSMATETMVIDRPTSSSGSSVDHRHAHPVEPKPTILARLLKALMMVVVVICGAIFGLYKMRWDIPALNTTKLYATIDSVSGKAEAIKGRVAGEHGAPAHGKAEGGEAHEAGHRVVMTSPKAMDVTLTQDYVCQIRSRRHIDVKILQDGFLEEIKVKEGQSVKAGDVLFKVRPVLYEARLAVKVAERNLAQLKLTNTINLAARQGVSQQEVKLFETELAKAQAEVDLAQAELNFATVHAPFDGIIDRLQEMQGSLVKEGDILTTLSDNNVMWVYFNVTERRYLEYMAETGQNKQSPDIELKLANLAMFGQIGKIGAIESNFNNETGNIAFRADFPNPDGLLRYGQTGTVLIKRPLKNAIVIPQRATFENLAKRYVYVVGEDHVAHQHEITIDHEQDDIFVIGKDSSGKDSLDVKDKIVLEGIRQIHDGEKVEGEFLEPEKALMNMKNHAE